MTDAAPLLRQLGPYLLLEPLGQGGMGAVYVAARTDTEQRELCLVKTLKSDAISIGDTTPRFLDEARVAVLLRHENLCQVYGGGEDRGEFYLAMELIKGVTFKRLLSLLHKRDARLSTTQALALTVGMLRGLHAAHTATTSDGKPLNVVHRDVSPHNTMVDVNGAIKVIDFGLATSVLKETMTESAVVLGKSAYMAPEQARGEDVTPLSDQYAAGIVLYELVTDDRFYGELPSRAIWSVVGAGTHQPRAWGDVPELVRPVLQRALAVRPSERFASCAEFADALAGLDAAVADSRASLGAIVRKLKPPELDIIATANVALAAWEARPKQPAAEVDGARTVDDDSAPPAALIENDATGITNATAVTRLPERPKKKAPLVWAAAAVVVVVACVVVGVAVSGPDVVADATVLAPTTPPTTTTTPTTTPTTTMQTTTTVTAPTPPPPLKEPEPPPPEPPLQEPEPPPPPKEPAVDPWADVIRKYKKHASDCGGPCFKVLPDPETARKQKKPLAVYRATLNRCIQLCREAE